MGGLIGQDKIAQVRQSCDIVEIISQHVGLKRTGRNHVGLCPFHAEKTPSFTVSEERRIFHCFGCGAGGDVFGFIMRVEGVSFPEAVRSVASHCGIPLPTATRERPANGIAAQLLELNDMAAGFFTEQLVARPVGEAGRRYLASRGVGRETSDRFRLGYAPGTGDALVRWLRNRKASLEMAARLGLVGKRETDNRYYDRFRHRLIFPVTDLGGRVVGFGSRALENGESSRRPIAKYLNSPETPVFRKGRYLYGLQQAREGVRRSGRAVVVEGYFDVLSLFEQGIDYAVASLGTALTAAQVAALGRFTRDVIACFDGDPAGEKAADRSLVVFVEAGMWGRGAFLPAGDDPDSFVRKHGKAALERIFDEAISLLDFFLTRVRPGPQADPGRRAEICRQVAGLLQKVKEPFAYDAAVKRASEMLGVSESLFRKEARRGRSQPLAQGRKPSPISGEAVLLELMIISEEVARMVADAGIMVMFAESQWRGLAEDVLAAIESGEQLDTTSLLNRLPPELTARVTERMIREEAEDDAPELRRKMAEELIAGIRRRHLRRLSAAVREQIRDAERRGDSTTVKAGLKKLEQLVREQAG